LEGRAINKERSSTGRSFHADGPNLSTWLAPICNQYRPRI